MTTWRVRSRAINETVRAQDQWGAWNTLRNRPLADFGLLTVAIPNDNEAEAIPVHTATLMRRWDRLSDARLCDAVARDKGLL